MRSFRQFTIFRRFSSETPKPKISFSKPKHKPICIHNDTCKNKHSNIKPDAWETIVAISAFTTISILSLLKLYE